MYFRRAHKNLRTAATVEDLDYWFAVCLQEGHEVIAAAPVLFTVYDAYRLRRHELGA